MAEKDKAFRVSPDFYAIIRNSQPIAFLASLSFVIAALVYRQGAPPGSIYNAAVTAAVLFILSFITSIANQIPLFRSQKASFDAIRFATYFFFALGILYWAFVAYEFSKDQVQIPSSISSFGMAYLGAIAAYGMYSAIKRSGRQPDSKARLFLDIAVSTTLGVAAASFEILAGLLIANSIGIIDELGSMKGWLSIIGTVALAFFTIFSIPDLLRLSKGRKESRKKSPI